MPKFRWKGKDSNGVEVSGVMVADSKEVVTLQLRRQKITPIKVSVSLKDLEIKIPGLGERITERDVVVFTRTFATMVDAGLPLVQCLEILAEQTENPRFSKAIQDIGQSVESGSTYADALRKHPKIFDDLYCNMVEAGETGGILDTILNRLAGYMEKSISLKRQVRSALVYPSVIVAVALGVVVFLMYAVVPTFEEIFTSLGATLPLPTQVTIAMSKFVQKNVVLLGALLIGAVIGFRYLRKTEKGLKMTDAMLLKMPVFGLLLRKVAVAKFTRTLSTLIASGVPILEGLEITAKTSGNKIIEDAILKTRVSISEGKTISEPLAATEVFPPMVTQMIAVGETTGALDSMLEKIADFYDEEVDITVQNLTQLLEPAMMVFLGVSVGFIVISMYMPMFSLVGELSK